MRLTTATVAVGILVALVLPFGAEADGNGAVKATIYEGGIYSTPVGTRTYAEGDAVGFAIFNATNDDMMSIKVHVKDALPDTTFVVAIVPGIWAAGTFSLATDGKGKGSLATEVNIPAGYIDSGMARIKVILTSGNDIYVTDDREPPFTNPPTDDLSTTHAVNLK